MRSVDKFKVLLLVEKKKLHFMYLNMILFFALIF